MDTAAVGDTFDISNNDRLGKSEVRTRPPALFLRGAPLPLAAAQVTCRPQVELVQLLIDGVNFLIESEKKLEKGQDITVPDPISQFKK